MDEEYDMIKTENGYEVTVKTSNYEKHLETIATYTNNVVTHYKILS